MSPAWSRRLKHLVRWLIIVAATPFVLVYGGHVASFLAALALPRLDNGEARLFVREWREHPEFRVADEKLEQALADKWRASQGVALSEIIEEPMRRACLATWVHWPEDDPVWELALRSDRLVWWRNFSGNSTVVVEFETGRVRAFRIKSYGHHPLDGGVFRFQPPLFKVDACARRGRLTFVPVQFHWGAYAFQVRGD
jgi:hypothetical protein